jgi:hypothetical protein
MADAVLASRLGPRESTSRGGGRGGAAAPALSAPAAVLAAVAGRYRSPELLGAVWEVAAGEAGAISVHRPRADASPVGWVADFTFASRQLTLAFDKPVAGRSPGFTVKGDRVEGLRFERIP